MDISSGCGHKVVPEGTERAKGHNERVEEGDKTLVDAWRRCLVSQEPRGSHQHCQNIHSTINTM